MQIKNSGELDKLNSKINDLKEQIKTAADDIKEKLQKELSSLEAKKDQLVDDIEGSVVAEDTDDVLDE